MGEGIQAAKLQVNVESNATTVSSEVQQLNQSVTQASTHGTQELGKLSQGFNLLQSQVLPAAGIVTGFAGTIKKAYEFGREGAQLEQLSDAAHRMALSMGSDMDLIIEKVQAATQRTIDDDAIMEISSRAMLMGLGSNAEQLANLAEVAAVRGRLAGESASEAFGSLVDGIGRMSSRMLVSMGIIIDEEAAFQAYADSLGVSADSLSDVEKRQAMVNAVLEDGNKLLKEQGGLVETDAMKYEQAMVAIDDAMDKVKTKFSPFWADVSQGLAGLLTFNDSVKGAIVDATQSAIEHGTSYQIYFDHIMGAAKEAGKVTSAEIASQKRDYEMLLQLEAEGKTNTDDYFYLLQQYNNAQEYYTRNFGMMSREIYEASKIPMDSWVTKLENDKKALEGAAEAAKVYNDVITAVGIEGELRKIQQDYHKSLDELVESQTTLDAQYANGKIDLEEYTRKTEENKRAHDNLLRSVNDSVKAFIFEQASVGLSGEALAELARSMGVMDEASYAAAVKQAELKAQYDNGVLSAEEYATKTANLATAIASLQNKDVTITVTTIENVIRQQQAFNDYGLTQSVYQGHGEATGMDGIVPGGYSNDNYLLQVPVQSGERVQITPANQVPLKQSRGGDTINIYPANTNYTRVDLMRDLRQSRGSNR